METYKIRHARADDINVIAKIYVNSWKYAYRGIVPQEYLDNLSVEKYMKKLKDISAPGEFVFELEGSVVGLAKVIACRDLDLDNSAEIQTIYFLPEYIGKGYGSTLLSWLREYASAEGYKNIIVWVLSANIRARRAYEKAGYKSDLVKINNIGGENLQETRYLLNL